MERANLCEDCAKPLLGADPSYPLDQFMGSIPDRQTRLEQIVKGSPYPLEALKLILEALILAQTRKEGASTTHVTAAELLETFRVIVVRRFGKGAKAKLESWNITRTEHIGDLVFGMIEARYLVKRPEDSPDDFVGVYEFDVVFPDE